MQKNAIIIFVLFSLMQACTTQKQKHEKAYDFYFDFKEEIKRLEKQNTKLEKTLIADSIIETQMQTPKWDVELQPFLLADINSFKFKEKYELATQDSGIYTVYTLTSNDVKLPIKSYRHIYESNSCVFVEIVKSEEGALSSTEILLQYAPKNYYFIKSQQKVYKVMDNTFEIKGVFID
jgi:hypothetical protein